MGLKAKGVYVDATIGEGGHALGILSKVPSCKVIGIDRDDEAIQSAQERLKGYDIHLFRDKFSNLKYIVQSLQINAVDGIVIDPGLSNIHLRTGMRGFSFMKDGPLDMRMDKRQTLSAWHVINKYSEKDLARILWEYGEEKKSRKIARAIAIARRTKAIQSSRELVQVIEKTIHKGGKINVATRTFQAIRIEVNKELDELKKAIEDGVTILCPQGRFCIISYHSLEDRIVKHKFKAMEKDGIIKILTKKPIRPGQEEVEKNPSSRSAKLRVGEKLS